MGFSFAGFLLTFVEFHVIALDRDAQHEAEP
jgi:hypothetical protein